MERVLLIAVAISNKDRWQKADALDELTALTETAGGNMVEKILQIRPGYEPSTLIGKGKIIELKELCRQHKIDLLIFDNTLTATQIRNITEQTEVRVIDRTALILDIFSQHARTAEAKAQVELAQLEYRRTNLIGFGLELSRLGGGIGTRGPGERKLEIDRRRIRERISALNKILTRIDKERSVQQKNRQPFFKISLAGYTNAGKSSLMNYLTNAKVKVAPYLFATLDSNTKPLAITNHITVLLTDTVGFIRNLPHELVASFRSTLSEIRNADLILHVIDSSDSDIDNKIEAVRHTLTQINCEKQPVLMVFNKIDRIFENEIIRRLKRKHSNSAFVSALTGQGIDNLKTAILKHIKTELTTRTFTIPVSRGDLINRLYENGDVIKRVQNDNKITLTVKGYRLALIKISNDIRASLRS
ncbi:MAG: GTPase HflX [Candidatus Latescibacteria bacterium]|nr:GTPase HflX [Candidatus Latescibacterota bacterium]